MPVRKLQKKVSQLQRVISYTCIDCGQELHVGRFKIGKVMSNDMFYCANPNCDRRGLTTVLAVKN